MKKKKKIIFSEGELFALERDLSRIMVALRDTIKDPNSYVVRELKDVATRLMTKRISGDRYEEVVS